MPVLHRLSGLDMYQIDFPVFRPSEDVATGQFRSVVAANAVRFSPFYDQLFEPARHAPAAQAGIHIQSQAFAGKGIDHGQNTDSPTGSEGISDEIQCPFLIGSNV